jgi:hypothetical protein
MLFGFRSCVLSIVCLLLTIAGCSKEELAEQVNKAKDSLSSAKENISKSAAQVSEKVAEKVAADGQASIQLDGDTPVAASYVNLIPLKDRGAVFQLRSYADSAAETFPSYLFQANTAANSLNSLVGQSVTGNLFVKKSQDSATWMNVPGQAVTLTISTSSEGVLKGQFNSGNLSQPDGTKSQITGTFEAIIEGGE